MSRPTDKPTRTGDMAYYPVERFGPSMGWINLHSANVCDFESIEEYAPEKTYTLAEIKAAFWREFHLCGELWFGYLGSDEDNEDYTQSEWEDFERELEKGE